MARLLVLTGEGIAAAMAIFLFTEAGKLMLTQGGPDGTGKGQIAYTCYLLMFQLLPLLYTLISVSLGVQIYFT